MGWEVKERCSLFGDFGLGSWGGGRLLAKENNYIFVLFPQGLFDDTTSIYIYIPTSACVLSERQYFIQPFEYVCRNYGDIALQCTKVGKLERYSKKQC